MIINLAGPPSAGKSTFAARFTVEHPQFTYCPIDEYRLEYQDEKTAWKELRKDVARHHHVIVESCGLNWRLGQLWIADGVRDRPIVTIYLTAELDVLLSRLEKRHKRPLPPPFKPEDEILAARYHIEHGFKQLTKEIHCTIDTSDMMPNKVYGAVNFAIARFMLDHQKKTYGPPVVFTNHLHQDKMRETAL